MMTPVLRPRAAASLPKQHNGLHSTPIMNLTGTLKYIVLLVFGLFMTSIVSMAQVEPAIIKTWVPTNGGAWTAAGNWSPSGVPVAGDEVVINSNQSAAITAVPSISLSNLTISGNVQLQGPSSPTSTLTLNGVLTVASGVTANFDSRVAIVFGAAASASIQGTMTSANDITLNSGNEMAIGPNGILNGAGTFTLNTGATLKIGSVNGIVATKTTASGSVQMTRGRTFSTGANYVYNGTSNQVTGDGLPTGLTGSLTIDNAGTVTIVNAARSITTGTLNLVRGVFATNNGGDRLSMGNSAASVTAVIKRSGGTLTGALLGSNWYAVEYLGASKVTGQELSGAGFRNMTVNFASADQMLYLNGNRTIAGVLTLTRGLIHTATNILSITSTTNGAITGHSADSYVQGNLQRAISNGASTYDFPVGAATYAPVILNFGSGTVAGTLTISTVEGDNANIAGSNMNVLRTVNRSWNFTAGSGLSSSGYNAQFNWVAADQDPNFSSTLATVGSYTGSWAYPSVSNKQSTSIQADGLTAFGEFQVGQACNYTAISQQPVGGRICADGSIDLSVAASGDGTLTYVWMDGSNVIPDAIQSTYKVTSAGSYKVTVTGECRTATSSVAVVSLKDPTTISVNPVGGAKCSGDLISVTGSGDGGTLSYQWYRNTVPISGAVNATYPVTEAGDYSVEVTGVCGMVASNVAAVTMNLPTRIITEPADMTITYGDNASFSVEAEGTSTLRYTWQIQSGSGWADLSADALYSTIATPTLNMTTPAVAYNGKKYKVQVAGLCGTVASREVTLTVNKALLTVKADNQSRIYGEADPSFTATYNGYKNSQNFQSAAISGTPSLTTAANATTPVGDYDINAAAGSLSAPNYDFTFAKGTMTITKAELTVTADNLERIYGEVNPDFTYKFTGFKNGETFGGAVASGEPVLTTLASALSDVNDYTITVAEGSLAATNYSFKLVNGTLKVKKATLTVTADAKSKVYGDENPSFTATYNGFKNGQDLAGSGVTGAPGYSTTATKLSGVGNYPITINNGNLASGNYAFSLANGNLTVTKAPLTVTANNASRIYGEVNPTFTATFNGFKNEETLATSDVQGGPQLSTLAVPTTKAGTYDITAAAGTLNSKNYELSFVKGTLTINKATLTVTVDPKERPYGDPNPVFTATFNGFKNSETYALSGVSGDPAYNTTATQLSNVGAYPVTASTGGLMADNYDFTFIPGSLKIVKSMLTVTAHDKTKIYGDENPGFTATIKGYKNGQTLLTSGVTGAAAFSTDADEFSPVGNNYTILPALGTLQSANYDFSYVAGKLSITKAPLTVTAVDTFRIYGDPDPVFRARYTGFKNNETFATSDLQGLPGMTTATVGATGIGSYPITTGAGSLISGNYELSYVGGNMEIRRASLTVTAQDKERTYGDENPVLTYTITGFKNGESQGGNVTSGEPVLNTAVTALTDAGNYTITIGENDLSAANYAFDMVNGKLKINPAVLQVTTDAVSRIYGDPNPDFTVTFTGFKNEQNLETSDVDGAPSYTTVANELSPVDAYDVLPTPGSLTSNNYTFNYNAGKITVTKAPLTVKAVDTVRAYGDPNPVFRVAYIGLKNNETYESSDLEGLPTLTTDAEGTSPVGPYVITSAAGNLASGNYDLSYDNGTLTVSKATLKVSVDNKEKTYGDANPELTYTLSGLKNSEEFSGAVGSGSPVLGTTAGTASDAGDYDITIESGDLAASNYDFELVKGTLTINKAVLNVTAQDATRIYGDANPSFVATITGYKLDQDWGTSRITGEPGFTSETDALTPVGTYDLYPTLGSLESNNYNFNYIKASLTITPAALTVKAVDTFRIYGDANPVYRASYSGFKNNENFGSSDLEGAPDLAAAVSATTPVGTYTITAAEGTLNSKNYTLSYEPALLTISPAALTVTAEDWSKVYGQANPTFTYKFSGFKNGETDLTSDVTGKPVLSTTAVTLSNVGEYPITIAQDNLASSNYAFTFVPGKLLITQATLNVKATDLTKTYGAAVPALTITYSGFATGQTLATSDLAGAAQLSTTAEQASNVGTYPITILPGDLRSDNYKLVFADGVLTVSKAPLTVTAEAKTRVYGDPNPEFTWTYGGYVLGEDRAASGVTGDPVLSTTAIATSNVGNYAITTGIGTLAAANYSFNLVNGTLAVTRAPLVVTADDKSKTYGAVNPAFTATYSGFKNNETSSVLRGAPAYSTTATQSSIVGTYPIVVSAGNLSATNYEFSYTNGTLTINKALLTVTADAKTRAYGAANPTLTATYTGFVLGQNLASSGVSGTPVLATAAGLLSPVGSYPITNDISGLSAANYTFNGVGGNLTVTKALLTVTADTKLKIYGDPNPILSVTFTGYRNNEDASTSGVTGAPSLTTTALTTSNVGTYPITVTAGTLAASNYSFTYVNGSLVIGKATVTVKADDKSRAYGSANPAFSVTYNGFVNGQTLASSGVTGAPATSTAATAASPVGTYPINVSNGTLAASNYNFAFQAGTLTVNKALVTVTADNKSRPYGGVNPALTATYTGFVNGQTLASSGITGLPDLTTAADELSPVGSYPVTAAAGTLAADNYLFTFVNGALNVVKATLQLRADNASKIYGAANPSFTYTLNGFVNGETAEIAGITGAPALTTTATVSSGVGTYPITPATGTLSAPNYTFSFVNGTLTVGKATLTVTPDNKTRTYGATNPAFTASYAGFVNNESLATSGVTGAPSMSTTANLQSGLGDYPITAVTGTLTAPNYSFTFASGTLTITRATLTVTADNKTKAYGAPLPALTATITGYVNGENASSAGISGAPVLSTLANTFSDMGTYPINATLGTLAANNYSFTLARGTLTVSPASCTAAGTLVVVDSCYDNLITLRFNASSGTGPFTLIINDSVYRNITSGTVFSTNTLSRAAAETIFSNDVVGEESAIPDPNSIEVGVKFRANVSGQVTGIRFFKLPGNTGTHTASLWTSTGTRLATATFTNETESGWQQVNFATPVTLTPGVTYVASYFAPAGNYAFDPNAFDATRLTNLTGSLTALGASDGGNGVFRTGGGFPATVSPVNANYFVDVVFNNVNSTSRFALNGIIASNSCAANGLPLQAPTVKMMPLINLNFTKNVLECVESKTGNITLTASGCNTPLQYSVDNGVTFQSSPVFNNLGAGTYRVRVKDNKNFSKDTVVVLDVDKSVWVGGSSGFWDNVNNWSTGSIPTASTHAIVPPGVKITVRANATAASIQLTGAGSNVEVNRNVRLTLTGKCAVLPNQ